MSKIKGQMQWEKFQRGEKLTLGEAVKANCYACNSFEESNVDCEIPDCALYMHSPHKKAEKRVLQRPPRNLTPCVCDNRRDLFGHGKWCFNCKSPIKKGVKHG